MRSLSSGMQSMKIWGRADYTQSSFLDDDDGATKADTPQAAKVQKAQKSPVLASASPRTAEAEAAAQKEAAKAAVAKAAAKGKAQPSSQGAWNQAATIRAQLQEELKKEHADVWSSPTIPDRSRSDTADSFGKRDKMNRDGRKPKKGSPDALFAMPSSDGLHREGVDPWGQTSPPAPSAAQRLSPKPAAAEASGGTGRNPWAQGTDAVPTFPWPQKASSQPQSSGSSAAKVSLSPPDSAAAAADSLANGFAASGWNEGENASPMVEPARRHRHEHPAESTAYRFDDAILAAAAALPREHLINLLQKLAQLRPAEVHHVFGAESNSSNRESTKPTSPLEDCQQPVLAPSKVEIAPSPTDLVSADTEVELAAVVGKLTADEEDLQTAPQADSPALLAQTSLESPQAAPVEEQAPVQTQPQASASTSLTDAPCDPFSLQSLAGPDPFTASTPAPFASSAPDPFTSSASSLPSSAAADPFSPTADLPQAEKPQDVAQQAFSMAPAESPLSASHADAQSASDPHMTDPPEPAPSPPSGETAGPQPSQEASPKEAATSLEVKRVSSAPELGKSDAWAAVEANAWPTSPTPAVASEANAWPTSPSPPSAETAEPQPLQAAVEANAWPTSPTPAVASASASDPWPAVPAASSSQPVQPSTHWPAPVDAPPAASQAWPASPSEPAAKSPAASEAWPAATDTSSPWPAAAPAGGEWPASGAQVAKSAPAGGDWPAVASPTEAGVAGGDAWPAPASAAKTEWPSL